MMDKLKEYVYVCFIGLDYEGTTIEKVFRGEQDAKDWVELNSDNGDYQDYYKEEVH
jgi:hypothetical protein